MSCTRFCSEVREEVCVIPSCSRKGSGMIPSRDIMFYLCVRLEKQRNNIDVY